MNKIFVFSNVGGGDGECLALAEDGVCLGSHWCSNEGWAQYDLGVVATYRLDRHETYAKHYPGGYEMEFVASKDIKRHAGLQAAIAAANALPPDARTEGDNFAKVEVTLSNDSNEAQADSSSDVGTKTPSSNRPAP